MRQVDPSREDLSPYKQSALLGSTSDRQLISGKSFSPARHPYHSSPAELKPLPRHAENSPHRVNEIEVLHCDNEPLDIGVCADRYLDLTTHCPFPSWSASPSAHRTSITEGGELDYPRRRLRRTTQLEVRIPRLFQTQISQHWRGDGLQSNMGVSPFFYSPFLSKSNDLPALSHQPHQYWNVATPSQPGKDKPPVTMKFTASKGDGLSKRQPLACHFCRGRKIACSRPSTGSADQTCNQCARRRKECIYPTESRRGQHSRIKSLAPRAEEAHNVGIILPALHH